MSVYLGLDGFSTAVEKKKRPIKNTSVSLTVAVTDMFFSTWMNSSSVVYFDSRSHSCIY